MLLRVFIFPACLICAFAFTSNHAIADVTIGYGVDDGGTRVIELQAETANHVVQFFATGIAADGGVDSLEFDVQIGDGGAFLGGTDTSPFMTSIDLITGTIWTPNSPSQTDPEIHPLIRQSRVSTTSLVNSDGLIGTIVFDTTGFGTGDIQFLLTGVAGSFSTEFFQGSNSLTTIAPNGIIRVSSVPEPALTGLLALGFVGIGLRRRRYRSLD